MEYKIDDSLERFHAWSGGKETLETLIEKGDCDNVECFIEEIFFDDIPTDTQVNDFLWFERDTIAEHLGYKDWGEYVFGKEEYDEEEEDDDDDEDDED